MLVTLDSRGHALALGDTVIYPVKNSTSVTLVEGVVTMLPIGDTRDVDVRRTHEINRYGGRKAVAQQRTVSVNLRQLVRLA